MKLDKSKLNLIEESVKGKITLLRKADDLRFELNNLLNKANLMYSNNMEIDPYEVLLMLDKVNVLITGLNSDLESLHCYTLVNDIPAKIDPETGEVTVPAVQNTISTLLGTSYEIPEDFLNRNTIPEEE